MPADRSLRPRPSAQAKRRTRGVRTFMILFDEKVLPQINAGIVANKASWI
jgi:hypothetical protein